MLLKYLGLSLDDLLTTEHNHDTSEFPCNYVETMPMPGLTQIIQSTFHWVVRILFSIWRVHSKTKIKTTVPYTFARIC